MVDEAQNQGTAQTVVPIKPGMDYGGGGPTGGDPLEARVKSLEDDMKKLLQDTAEIKGMLRAAPSAIEFGELKGRVNALPTTAKVAAIVSIVGVLVTLALRWTEIVSMIPKP